MPWIGAAIAAAAALAGTIITNHNQKKQNRQLAATQHSANQELLKQQLEYDAPKSQMQRFQAAGLNPNLVYGQGSPGNQSTPLKYPDIKPAQLQNVGDALGAFNQTRLADSQVQATDATVRQKTALADLNRLQAQVLSKNPLLDDAGFKATIDSLKSSAEIKASESGIRKTELWVAQASGGHQVNKLYHEVELLEQRFKLGEIDAKIKSQVVQSKEFQNAILEVQKRFMTDAEVTPQHILQFIQLLLMKLL